MLRGLSLVAQNNWDRSELRSRSHKRDRGRDRFLVAALLIGILFGGIGYSLAYTPMYPIPLALQYLLTGQLTIRREI